MTESTLGKSVVSGTRTQEKIRKIKSPLANTSVTVFLDVPLNRILWIGLLIVFKNDQ